MLGDEHPVKPGLFGKHGVFYEDLGLKLLVPAKIVKLNVCHSRPIIAHVEGAKKLASGRSVLRPCTLRTLKTN